MASQDWFDKDFYKILGVAKDVTEADLKKTYRQLARKYHPDSNPGDAKAETKFKEISEAYSVLSDPKQRKEYDAIRAMGGGARFRAPSGGGPGGASGFEDIFRDLFGGNFGGDSFGGGFGGGGFGFPQGGGFGPTPGSDVTAEVTIDFIDGVRGVTRKLTAPGLEPISFKVPAGVKDGQKIKLRGKGKASLNGGVNGDLIITVHVKPHAVFTREGHNLRVTVPITFTEATLGATIQVPTLGGEPVKLKVAAGTPNGRVLRVKGKGVVTDKHQGDLLATVEIVVPQVLTNKSMDLLRRFEESLPRTDPRADLLNKAGLL